MSSSYPTRPQTRFSSYPSTNRASEDTQPAPRSSNRSTGSASRSNDTEPARLKATPASTGALEKARIRDAERVSWAAGEDYTPARQGAPIVRPHERMREEHIEVESMKRHQNNKTLMQLLDITGNEAILTPGETLLDLLGHTPIGKQVESVFENGMSLFKAAGARQQPPATGDGGELPEGPRAAMAAALGIVGDMMYQPHYTANQALKTIPGSSILGLFPGETQPKRKDILYCVSSRGPGEQTHLDPSQYNLLKALGPARGFQSVVSETFKPGMIIGWAEVTKDPKGLDSYYQLEDCGGFLIYNEETCKRKGTIGPIQRMNFPYTNATLEFLVVYVLSGTRFENLAIQICAAQNARELMRQKSKNLAQESAKTAFNHVLSKAQGDSWDQDG